MLNSHHKDMITALISWATLCLEGLAYLYSLKYAIKTQVCVHIENSNVVYICMRFSKDSDDCLSLRISLECPHCYSSCANADFHSPIFPFSLTEV